MGWARVRFARPRGAGEARRTNTTERPHHYDATPPRHEKNRHGEGLFLACQRRFRARPFWVDGAGHNNIESLLRDSGAFFEHLRYFLDEWCRERDAHLS